MNRIKDVSLVAIKNEKVDRHDLAAAMSKSLSIFPFKEALLFTDVKLKKNYEGVQQVITPFPLEREYVDYLMLSEVPNHVSGTHYITMSSYYYPNNIYSWDDHFLDYHFVAGRWLHHPDSYIPPHPMCGPHNDVGFGSLSLRSKLFGQAAAALFRESWKNSSIDSSLWTPETYYIGRTIRPLLESKGFKYATKEIADKFFNSDTNYSSIGTRYFGIYTNIQ
jgi:3',5'-cyclic AMP phosphodiesterase CpdA